MSQNIKLVHKMVEQYCHMDADGLLLLLHPEAKHRAPGSDFGAELKGAETIAEYFRTNVFPSFHSVRFELVDVFEDSAKSTVIAEWRSHLRPKNGKDYSNNGVFVIEIRDGKIAWVREYFDTQKAHEHVQTAGENTRALA